MYQESRAPQGARGLKSQPQQGGRLAVGSRPARGAWIEIASGVRSRMAPAGRAPQGARGLK